jgi:hypothetical protein
MHSPLCGQPVRVPRDNSLAASHLSHAEDTLNVTIYRLLRTSIIAWAFVFSLSSGLLLHAEHEEDCQAAGTAQRCTDCGCHIGHGCSRKHSTLCWPDDTCENEHPNEDCYFVDMD